MTWGVSAAMEALVWEVAAARLPARVLAPTALHAAIKDRARRYTSERERLASPGDPESDLAARALFYTLADAGKVALPVLETQLAWRGAVDMAKAPLRILDLGAGCGAMSLGLLETLHALGWSGALELTLVEQDRAALGLAAAALTAFAQHLGLSVRLRTEVADVTHASAVVGRHELVVMGTVLNELTEADALGLVKRAWAATAGALLLLEPALRETSRRLHRVRDEMVAQGAHVWAPCRGAVGCPALVKAQDWCHEDRPSRLPPRTAELARVTHLRDDGFKFAYVALGTTPPLHVADAWRVVAAPHRQKGKLEVLACGAQGWQTLRLLGRNRSAANRALEAVARGDVVVVDGGAASDARLELGPTTTVQRLVMRAPRADDA